MLSLRWALPKLAQQFQQLVEAAMYITDNVEWAMLGLAIIPEELSFDRQRRRLQALGVRSKERVRQLATASVDSGFPVGPGPTDGRASSRQLHRLRYLRIRTTHIRSCGEHSDHFDMLLNGS